jgi:hypothetical protein
MKKPESLDVIVDGRKVGEVKNFELTERKLPECVTLPSGTQVIPPVDAVDLAYCEAMEYCGPVPGYSDGIFNDEGPIITHMEMQSVPGVLEVEELDLKFEPAVPINLKKSE